MALGFHAGIAQGDISQIERRRVIPSSTYLDRLAHVLGVDAEQLLDEVTEPGDATPAEMAQ